MELYEELSAEAWTRAFARFLERGSRACALQLVDIAGAADASGRYVVDVDPLELLERDARAGVALLRHPERLVPLFDQAARRALVLDRHHDSRDQKHRS